MFKITKKHLSRTSEPQIEEIYFDHLREGIEYLNRTCYEYSRKGPVYYIKRGELYLITELYDLQGHIVTYTEWELEEA